jgi:Fe-S-cluster containining protein
MSTDHGGRPAVFDVQLQTATGPLRGRVAIDAGPMRLADLVPQAAELADLLTSRAIAREKREGRSISCSRGCAACCRPPVPLSIPEVLFIVDLVRRLPEPRRSEVEARFRRAEAALEEAGQAPIWIGPAYDQDAALASIADYLRLGIACPFLEAESCGIYAARPTRCREFLVTTPAAWCSTPEENPVRAVPTDPMSAPLARLTARLTGSPIRLIPLTLALRWAEEHADLGERVWPGPQLFEAFLRELAREADPGVPEQPPG